MTSAPFPRNDNPLADAVARGDWQVVACYLLLGVSRAAAKLPPDSLTALVELLGGSESGDEHGRDGKA